MTDNTVDGSSPGASGLSSKRQRLEASRITSSNNSAIDIGSALDVERMKREIESLRAKLSQTESTITICRQRDDLAKQEIAILEMRSKLDSEIMKQQQNDLEAAMRNIQDAREAQVAVESELSQTNASTHKRIKELMLENTLLAGKTVHSTCGLPPTSSQCPQPVSGIETKLRAAELRIIELKQQLERNSTLQRAFDQQEIKFDQAKPTIKELAVEFLHRENPKELLAFMLTRVKRLEEELQIAMDLISVIHKDDESSGQNAKQDDIVQAGNPMKSDEQQRQSQSVDTTDVKDVIIEIDSEFMVRSRGFTNFNEEKSDGESSLDVKDETLQSSVPPFPKTSENISWSSFSVKLEDLESHSDMRSIGSKRCYPTNPKFFEIDWKKECYKLKQDKSWNCMKCSKMYVARRQMQDHVWVGHYKEKFQCGFCTHRFSRRNTLDLHIRKSHPELFCNRQIERKISDESE